MTYIPTTKPEDMGMGAMVLRAHEGGQQLETYDPNMLVKEVVDLLTSHGLHPQIPSGTGRAGMAAGASGKLLRAMGILPAEDERAIDRLNAPDPDSR